MSRPALFLSSDLFLISAGIFMTNLKEKSGFQARVYCQMIMKGLTH